MSATATQPISDSTVTVRPTIVTWFEIPTEDFERAVHFYEAVFGIQLRRELEWPGMAIFPYQEPGISGCVFEGKNVKPSANGVLVYLNCDNKLDAVLARLAGVGGAVLEKKNHIPGIGWVAQMRDSEGNRIGLHAVV
jgi:predicted enzyme related to lactoylglutathione lyase